MLLQKTSRHNLKIRLIQSIVLILLGLSTTQRLTHQLENNRFSLNVLKSYALVLAKAPWSSHVWWYTLCNTEGTKSEFDFLNIINTSNNSVYLENILAAANGDCDNAIGSLQNTVNHKSNAQMERTVLAYIYSMTGQWSESINLFPTKDIPVGNWPLRRYWGNVLLRAGIANQPSLIQESESLLGTYLPDTNVALYEYWTYHGNLLSAFEELRWNIAGLDESKSHQFLEDYQSLAEQYVTIQAAANPTSEKWKRLSGQRAVESSANHSQPRFFLNYQWDEQWMLWGFDFDEAELALGPFVPVTLYWRPLDTISNKELLIERRVMQNYVPDAGFEWGEPLGRVRPFGYNALYNNRYPYPYEIVLDGGKQQFCLFNNRELQNTGVQTRWFSSPNTSNRLIIGGDYQTEQGGLATIGLRWRGYDGEVTNKHVVSGEESLQWHSVAQVIQIPDIAEEIAFQFLQFKNSGTACFDNLFMFAVDGPSNEAK
jgi:hypothetical protein